MVLKILYTRVSVWIAAPLFVRGMRQWGDEVLGEVIGRNV